MPSSLAAAPTPSPSFAPSQNSSYRRFSRVSSQHIVHTTDATFSQDVLKSEKPVLLDFWAEWCGPCKQIAPALDQISEELADLVTIAKLDIEESPGTPSRYGVRGIPTMMLFRGGQMASMKVGAMPKQKILDWLNEAGVGVQAA